MGCVLMSSCSKTCILVVYVCNSFGAWRICNGNISCSVLGCAGRWSGIGIDYFYGRVLAGDATFQAPPVEQ